MQIIVRRLIISGRVQGVGYRYAMERKAREAGVRGWVRNRFDGSVEAMVAGESAAVEAMVEWSRRGPRNAVVAAVEVTEGEGDYTSFETRPTA